jgi:hypothetical protein
MHLAAQMPPAKIGSRGLMELRIARKIAALSGIPGDPHGSDDAGRGRSWLVDYRELTTTEITLGGPVIPHGDTPDGGLFHRPERGGRRFRHVDGDAVDYAPIPNVAVQAYGPDTKAALVLTGANRVLEPVATAVRRALDDISRKVDSPSLAVAVGLCLLQEVFAAQPILVRNGVQAAHIQRALMLPGPDLCRPNHTGRALSRIEYGGRIESKIRHSPQHLEVIHSTWDSVFEHDQYDGRGRLRGKPARLLFNPLFGFEQNDTVAATGQPEHRTLLIAMLEDISEALLTGSMAGAPLSTIHIDDPAQGPPFAEVVVPRQRQVELIVASMARQLAPLPGRPIQKGQVLFLPELDVARWRASDELTRRAVLLAHYYTLRAAGWFSGMIKLDLRRSREDCADRCQRLAEAADQLLHADDPLGDQTRAYAWGYMLQYQATFGGGAELYPKLTGVLERLLRRVEHGHGGKAILIELLPMVLDNLRSVRWTVSTGLAGGHDARRLTEDLQRWWNTARQLRDELIREPAERSHLDHGYARFLIDPVSDDASLRRGLELIYEVSASGQDSAAREARSIGLRMSYLARLQGHVEALRRWTDPAEVREHAQRAFEVAKALNDHQATWTFLHQRVDPSRPGKASYDGAAMLLLVTLAQGWLAALRSGVLDEPMAKEARDGAERAVDTLRGYLTLLHGRQPLPPGGHAGSQLDPLRARFAEETLEQWRAWESSRPAGGERTEPGS